MISVVIPSYNRKDCIVRLLGDVFAQKDVEFEVIVIDDCSSDDTADAVRRDFPQAIFIENETNGGPCVTRNRGVRAARGDIIVGFDSDVSIADTYLLAKVAEGFANSPERSGFAFRIFEPDGITDDSPRWWHPVSIAQGCDRRFESDYFSGTAYAFRRTTMIDAGLFPEILYMHYEEVELAYRILDQGGSIYYRPDFTAVHHANPVSRRSEIKVFYKPRNQVLLAMRCYPVWRGLCYLTPRLINGMVQALIHRTFRDWWRAMRSAGTLAPECLNNRASLKSSTWKRIASMKHQLLKSSAGRKDTGVATPSCSRLGK